MTETNSILTVTIAGQSDTNLSNLIQHRLQERIKSSGDLNSDEIYYVSNINLELVNSELAVDPKTLEKLRQLCQLWDLQFQPINLTSHRKFIGPLIVTAKRMFFPVLKLFLKDVIQRQKLFNATTIGLLAQLANQKK